MGKLRCVIRLGDATSHGGKVISASSTTFIRGKPIARIGDGSLWAAWLLRDDTELSIDEND